MCIPLGNGRAGSRVWLEFKEQGAKVERGQIIYTLNGGEKGEEWFRCKAFVKGNRLHAELPERTTHYFFNLIDENNFLVSYPEPLDMLGAAKTKPKRLYSLRALFTD